MPRPPSVPFLVDSLGRAQQKLKPLKKLEKEAKDLGAQLVTLLGLKEDEERYVTGRKFAGTISACSFEREITDKQALLDILGDERYIKEAKMLLGRLDELLASGELTEAQLKQIVTTTQTGHRKFLFLPKAA